jgi:hypothetical protein
VTRDQSRPAKPTARARKPTPRIKPAECVFRKGFVTEVIDYKVDGLWKAGLGGKTPFGDLRNMFRRHHCRTLNPYGDSERCPFTQKECALAFLEAVQVTVQARPRVPMGYFIHVAKSSGARRADEAVERRAVAARLRRTDVHLEAPAYAYQAPTAATERPDPGGVGTASVDDSHARPGGGEGLAERATSVPSVSRGDSVPSRGHGAVSVGDLLGRVAPRPREGRPEDRREGP